MSHGGVKRACIEAVPVELKGGWLDVTCTMGIEKLETNAIEIFPVP